MLYAVCRPGGLLQQQDPADYYAGSCWDTDSQRSRNGTNNYSRAFLFPRLQDDPILDILNNVEECRTNDRKVWVAISKFDADGVGRGIALRDKLDELEDVYGCNVQVVVSGQGERNFLDDELTCVGHLAAVHHKFLLIDAKFNGQWRTLVFTGSRNWNEEGQFFNDEAMVRLQHAGLFSRYQDYYNELYDLSSAPACP